MFQDNFKIKILIIAQLDYVEFQNFLFHFTFIRAYLNKNYCKHCFHDSKNKIQE